ncbi:alcohol dehydrogenase catalytic domain-containing protein [Isoptericola sp. b441]|uniref:alcohol dehydrogenase n=1 Tax=Actinotalea lenta TaxID=3064654 RepID=A0ABT9DBT4_9CELL|nr:MULTISPECIES: alcohol dehydrogenase catalytic domain-containing protein [unclassified Isoptericola]MDO8108344.1 alcohol dehydrogenase catalytic domain-containing protein [Isoptericola sp. b441]MDO8119743.1 alcohol dehydrogenase catalytic domain-containing protein [Isoptericola sp. b490]
MHANQLLTPAPISEHPLTWRETDRPEPGEGQLLIKVAGCGVCRSNLHMIEGDWVDGGVPAISPIVPGHEATGRVEAVGAGVEGFAVGDPVGVQPLWWTCGECEFCTSGREQLCHRRIITGEHVDGGYAEYLVSWADHTYHVPENLDLVEAAPLFCPGITAYGVVDKIDVGPGDVVAVFGLGGVGHMAVQMAALTGAEVVAVGRTPAHLEVARELGAARTVDSRDPAAMEAIADSADAVLTFAGSDAVTAQAMQTLKWGGTLVNAVPITVQDFHFNKGQTIKGSILGNREQMRAVLRLASEGKIRTVVERFPMADAAHALEELAAGRLRSRAVLHT